MSTATAIQTQAEQAQPPAAHDSSIVLMIERAARDPNVDIDKMERLMAMQERMVAQRAKSAYVAALSEVQINLPVITERGRIEVRDKADPKKIIQSTSFARWEDINDVIRPILHAHGFALSFRNGTATDGKVTVTAVLSHRDGHQEETTITLPYDSSGSKNSVQAVGSSTSYGKRYATIALLNITSRGEDDDGRKAGEPATITGEQENELAGLIRDTRASLARFLSHLKVDCLPDIPKSRFEEARKVLLDRKRDQERDQ